MKDRKRNPEREALIKVGVNNSPYYKHLCMRLTGFTDEGSFMEMDVIPEQRNIWGNMHGGAISGLIDSSCGTSIGPMLESEETVVTLDLRVQFFKPVREGLLTAHGRVVHNTKRHIITESEVRDREGDLVARGNTIHILVRSEKLKSS